MKNQIILNNAKFWTDERDILFCEYSNRDSQLQLDVDIVESFENAIMTLTKGKPMAFLIDVRNAKFSFGKTVAKRLANSEVFKTVKIYEAFVVNSISNNLSINSYKRKYEPKTPFIILTDMQRAIDFCEIAKNRYYASN